MNILGQRSVKREGRRRWDRVRWDVCWDRCVGRVWKDRMVSVVRTEGDGGVLVLVLAVLLVLMLV